MKIFSIFFILLNYSAYAYEIYPECKTEVYQIFFKSKASTYLNWPGTDIMTVNSNCNNAFNSEKKYSVDQAMALSSDVDKISKSLLDNAFTAKDTNRIRAIILNCQNRVEANHKLAALAANGVYEFKAPPGYKVVQKIEHNEKININSGVKLYILAPIDESPNNKLPYILSFAGTKDGKDAMSDLGFGADHYDDIRNLLYEGSLVFNKLKSGKDLIITGHSLGGALAQAAAASLVDSIAKKQLVDQKFKTGGSTESWGKIKLVTFNSFGGEKLSEYANRHLDEQIAAQGLIANLPVRNKQQSLVDGENLKNLKSKLTDSVLNESVHYRIENDAVSKLGNHYGEIRVIKAGAPKTFLASAASLSIGLPNLYVVGKAHLMSTVLDSLENNGYSKATVTKEKEIGLGNWFTEITNKAYSQSIADVPEKLKRERLDQYAKEGLYNK